MFQLPYELQTVIYEFDNTKLVNFNKCLKEIKYIIENHKIMIIYNERQNSDYILYMNYIKRFPGFAFKWIKNHKTF